MTGRLIDWWRRRRFTRPRLKQVSYYTSRHDVPESVPRHTVAVVGTEVAPKWAIFECPCGRGHQLVVNLSAMRTPCWRLTTRKRCPSLYPSIDYKNAIRCHFWLRGGFVEWVPTRRRGDSVD